MGKLLDLSTDDTNTNQQPDANNESQPPRDSRSKTSNTNLNGAADDLSSSLVKSVNIAAETARLVLGQANEETVKSAITTSLPAEGEAWRSLAPDWSPVVKAPKGDEVNHKLDEQQEEGGEKTVSFSLVPPESRLDDSRMDGLVQSGSHTRVKYLWTDSKMLHTSSLSVKSELKKKNQIEREQRLEATSFIIQTM